jgi:stage III sporulation protein AG
MSENRFNEEEFLKKVENAARKGANSKGIIGMILQYLPILIVLAVVLMIANRVNAFGTGVRGFMNFDNGAEENDLVLENHGILGYTAANFEDAILGDSEKLKKLEVFSQEVSDVSTVTETGFINWEIFSKNQLITYNGTAVYTVDLSTLSADDIDYDEEQKIITLRIPHAVQEEINIPEDQIQFGDTNGGLLAFGEIKMSAEQASQIQAGAREKMEEKLKELLEAIDGAGEVEVMITLESCYENVYLKDKNLKTESGNGDFKEESDETYIMAKTSSNTQEGVIIKVYEPVVKGVAVVATGGESEKVKMAIIETVSAVFNIDSTNISVEKMKTERKE